MTPIVLNTTDGKRIVLNPDSKKVVALIAVGEKVYHITVTEHGKLIMT